MPHRKRRDGGTGHDQISRLNHPDELSRDRHHDHGDDTAGRQHEPREYRGIAQFALQQLRENLRRCNDDRATRTKPTWSMRSPRLSNL